MIFPRTRVAIRWVGALGALGLGLVAVEPFLPSPYAPRIHVRWEDGLGGEERQRLESAFRLAQPESLEGATWRYDLVDPRPENVAALIAHPAVADTHEIDRIAGVVQPGAPRGTTWIRSRALYFWRVPQVLGALAIVSAAAVFLPLAWLVLTRLRWSLPRLFAPVLRFHRWGPLAAPITGVASAAAIAFIGGTSVVRAAAACGVVYLCGYVTGALLVPPREDDTTLSMGIVRTIAGLLLTTMGFFLCLRLSVPWVIGPAALVLIAAMVCRRAAFTPPRLEVTLSWGAVFTGLAALIAVAPFLIAAVRMAPGNFPPVFFSVDTPYFLEQVHSLATTTTFPPPSLSFVDGRRSYHFGSHGIAALISRSSGLAPHHTVFLVVLPLLTVGIIAAAVVLARRMSPQLPSLVSIPMLLTPVPTLWYGFWSVVGPRMTEAASTWTTRPLRALMREWQSWGVASIEGHNLAAHFLVLACLAGLAATPTRGWRLPIFLVGIAFIVKTSTGVDLLAGFVLVQAVRAATERTLRPLMPALAAVMLFGIVYTAFWVVPGASAGSGLRPLPLYQVTLLNNRGGFALAGFGADVMWLLLPGLIAVTVAPGVPHGRSLPLLLLAVAPFILVNTLHASGGTGFPRHDDDWLQLMISVPLLLRALVLSVAGQCWPRFGAVARAAFLCAVALAVVPPLTAAANYAAVLIWDPKNGHEFAENRALGEALAIIPTERTILVTNDLRYPARITGLFGHQGFALNYQYELYPFSEERFSLQQLLIAPAWTDAIEHAAQKYHWTHLLVHKNYAHPAAIPLERVFDNDAYTVFRFAPTTD